MTPETLTLGLFSRTLDNPYQRLLRSDFYARAHAHGFRLVDYNARNDPQQQLEQIRDSIRSAQRVRPVAVLVTPVDEGLLHDAAREAARLGVGWVCLNRSCHYVEELRREYPTLNFFCVDPDQRQIGRLQGQQFRILLPAGGDLLYIQGAAATSSARLRLAGAEAEVRSSPIRMDVVSGDWSADSGFQVTKAWLERAGRRNWSQCVIGAQNDTMAQGAYKALLEEATSQGRPELLAVRLTGCDGLPSHGEALVRDGLLAATVVMPSTTGTAVDTLAAALRGRPQRFDVSLPVLSFPDLDELARGVRRARARLDADRVDSIPPSSWRVTTAADASRRVPSIVPLPARSGRPK
jgi:ABC-type sugar transport system substrate-binding protein